MNRAITLFFIAIITFAVVFFIMRPDVWNDIWLWLIGFAGVIVEVGRRLLSPIFGDKKNTSDTPEQQSTNLLGNLVKDQKSAELRELATDQFKGVTLSVLRYSDDGKTTVGLLYLNGFFYCYTLEDTHRAVKVAGQTRVPAGKYELDFNRADTGLTLKYRNTFSEWFTYHLEIKNIPGFQGVYIHNGGTNEDTDGCLLVSDSLSVSETTKSLTNSRNTFKRLYTYLKEEIEKGTKVRIIMRDEVWFAKLNA
ncbi:MAG: DUF5675 family protein [Cyclobacteriaceae bacterium]|nr:DUF5675 family protein [Cyclobacteriaceae bacterium]